MALLVLLIRGLLTGSGAYQDAVAAAKADPLVQQALGTPIDEGWMVTGQIETRDASGYADLAIPLSGPDGRAVLYATAERTGAGWQFDVLEVEISGSGEIIDLLTAARAPY